MDDGGEPKTQEDYPTTLQRRAKLSLTTAWPNSTKALRIPRFIEAAGYIGRLRTFVVIEVYEGHQMIEHWICNDLVQHINQIGNDYLEFSKDTESFWMELGKESVQRYLDELGTREHDQTKTVDDHTSIHYHYHYYQNQHQQQSAVSDQHPTWKEIHPVLSNANRLCYRDLRQIFTDGSPIPSIEVRQHCIIICLPPLSCVIMADRVFILVVEDLEMDGLISNLRQVQLRHMGKLPMPSAPESDGYQLFMKHRGTDVHSTEETKHISHVEISPFPLEIQALELLISAAFEQLDSDILCMETSFSEYKAQQTTEHPTTEANAQLHNLLNQTRAYQDRVTLYDRALNTIMSNGDELAMLELTKYRKEQQLLIATLKAAQEILRSDELQAFKKKLSAQVMADVDPDIENLLEFFDQEIEMFRQRLSQLHEKLQSAERLSTFKLSLNRTKMIRLDVISSLLGAVCGLGTAISGLFGMNMRNGWEEDIRAFWLFAMGIILLTICSAASSVVFVRRIKL